MVINELINIVLEGKNIEANIEFAELVIANDSHAENLFWNKIGLLSYKNMISYFFSNKFREKYDEYLGEYYSFLTKKYDEEKHLNGWDFLRPYKGGTTLQAWTNVCTRNEILRLAKKEKKYGGKITLIEFPERFGVLYTYVDPIERERFSNLVQRTLEKLNEKERLVLMESFVEDKSSIDIFDSIESLVEFKTPKETKSSKEGYVNTLRQQAKNKFIKIYNELKNNP